MGQGLAPNVQMAFEFIRIWVFCGMPTDTEIFNMSDCPDLSPTALTRCTDMSINYPEACCGSCFPQAHLARGGTLKYKCDIILMVMGDWTLVPKKTFFTRKHGYLPQSRQQGGSFSLFIPDVLFHHDHNMSTGSSLALVDIQLLFQSINRGRALGTTLLSEMINEIYVQSYWLWAGQAMVTN